MRRLTLLPVAACIIFACSKQPEQQAAPVSYEMKTFRLESQGGCASDSLPCALYEVTYPVFAGLDSTVAQAIQKKIDAAVSMGNPEKEGESMESIAKGFITDFDDFKDDIPQQTPLGWHYTGSVAVEVLTDSLMSLSVAEEYFTGGAHGGYGTYFINVRPKNGEPFKLGDFFKAGYEQPVTKAAEKVFRRVRELSDSASLDENMFEFPDNSFQLNENYGFTKEGVVFFFNSYEIAAYAAGSTEVIVPYEELKDWIKPSPALKP